MPLSIGCAKAVYMCSVQKDHKIIKISTVLIQDNTYSVYIGSVFSMLYKHILALSLVHLQYNTSRQW